jgi:predicted phosphohydrolase
MIRFINITKEAKMEELHKKDIKIYKKEIERLYKKIDYLEELDRKNFLQIIKLQGVINNYENNHIPYYKYEELQNNYINALQIINNKNKEANNE